MIKKNSLVYVITGNSNVKGKKAKVTKVLPTSRVLLEPIEATEPKTFINPIKKHVKKTQEKPEGSIDTREGSIHISNLMLASDFENSRRGKKSS